MAQPSLENNNGTTRLVRSADNAGLFRNEAASKLSAEPSIHHLVIKPTKEDVVRREGGEAVHHGIFLDSSK